MDKCRNLGKRNLAVSKLGFLHYPQYLRVLKEQVPASRLSSEGNLFGNYNNSTCKIVSTDHYVLLSMSPVGDLTSTKLGGKSEKNYQYTSDSSQLTPYKFPETESASTGRFRSGSRKEDPVLPPSCTSEKPCGGDGLTSLQAPCVDKIMHEGSQSPFI